MKQFIVLAAVLPIILVIMLQIGFDQRNSQKISFIQEAVYSAKEEARQQGAFNEDIRKKLISDISEVTGIAEEKITIDADEDIKYRYDTGDDRLVYFKVSVVIDDIMAGAKFFGVADEENKLTFTIDSYTASERL